MFFFLAVTFVVLMVQEKKNPSALYLKIHHKHRLIWIVWLLKRLQNASSDFVVIHFKWGTEVASCLNLLTFFCLQCLSRQLWPSEEDTVVAFKDRGKHIHLPETTFTCTIILLFLFFSSRTDGVPVLTQPSVGFSPRRGDSIAFHGLNVFSFSIQYNTADKIIVLAFKFW